MDFEKSLTTNGCFVVKNDGLVIGEEDIGSVIEGVETLIDFFWNKPVVFPFVFENGNLCLEMQGFLREVRLIQKGNQEVVENYVFKFR